MKAHAPIEFAARVRNNVLIEHYRYAPGPAPGVPLHAHDDYQIGLPETLPGLYRYRGATLPVPPCTLSVLHPGEPHGSLPRGPHAVDAVYKMLYVPRAAVGSIAEEMRLKCREPWFAEAVVGTPNVVAIVRAIHDSGSSPLRDDELIRQLLAALVKGASISVPPSPTHPEGLRRARDLLHHEYRKPLTLADLSRVAGMSPFHFARSFRREFGLAPHAYQTMRRLNEARRAIAAGQPIDRVARRVGFYDQSHLNRHFRRAFGLTPGQYMPARRSST